jgi:hypothetical protein
MISSIWPASPVDGAAAASAADATLIIVADSAITETWRQSRLAARRIEHPFVKIAVSPLALDRFNMINARGVPTHAYVIYQSITSIIRPDCLQSYPIWRA